MEYLLMTTNSAVERPAPSSNHRIDGTLVKGSTWLFEHWLAIFLVLLSVYWITPFFAPIFMHWGWTKAADLIYTIYSTQCHQMAQRSFFLFGAKPMYNIDQLP